jgi:hypothetical protein
VRFEKVIFKNAVKHLEKSQLDISDLWSSKLTNCFEVITHTLLAFFLNGYI